MGSSQEGLAAIERVARLYGPGLPGFVVRISALASSALPSAELFLVGRLPPLPETAGLLAPQGLARGWHSMTRGEMRVWSRPPWRAQGWAESLKAALAVASLSPPDTHLPFAPSQASYSASMSACVSCLVFIDWRRRRSACLSLSPMGLERVLTMLPACPVLAGHPARYRLNLTDLDALLPAAYSTLAFPPLIGAVRLVAHLLIGPPLALPPAINSSRELRPSLGLPDYSLAESLMAAHFAFASHQPKRPPRPAPRPSPPRSFSTSS